MRKWLLVVLGAAVLFGVVMGIGLPRSASAHWTPWYCDWTITNHPVSGGSLSARGCANWWTHSELWWEIWSDTYVPYSYKIRTYAEGSDRCGANPFKVQMSSLKDVYGNTYGTSGPAKVGPYQDCTGGHDYKAYTCNWRWRYSTSSAEGKCGSKPM